MSDAPSDGAIVVHVASPDPTYKPPIRRILRFHIPDFIIALWLGASAGALIGECIRRWLE